MNTYIITDSSKGLVELGRFQAESGGGALGQLYADPSNNYGRHEESAMYLRVVEVENTRIEDLNPFSEEGLVSECWVDTNASDTTEEDKETTT